LLDIILIISISSFLCKKTKSARPSLYDLKPEAVWQNCPFSAEIYRNLCLYVSNFPGRHPWTKMKIWLRKAYNVSIIFILVQGYLHVLTYLILLTPHQRNLLQPSLSWASQPGSRVSPKKIISAENGQFCHTASSFKSCSYDSYTKRDMDISITWYLANIWAKLCL
jgi:hypothetical protein